MSESDSFIKPTALKVACYTLYFLGATMVYNQATTNDPTTEEEFQLLQYDAPRKYTWEEYQAAIEPAKERKASSLLRMYRNGLLQQSDYIMTVDFSEKLSNIDEWKVYRQALRDYTNTPFTYVWLELYEKLDFLQMNFPQKPQLIYK